MADLSTDKTTDESPFTNCGVDMFGPFLIKEQKKSLKDMEHYLHAYLVGQSILNALVAWRQILS